MADQLQVELFGRFSARYRERPLDGCEGAKAKELFCYLLLHRDRPHVREGLASLLWGDDCTTARSRTYLRKALWQLQAGLGARLDFSVPDLLRVEAEWVRLSARPHLALDVDRFEAAFASTESVPGEALAEGDSKRLKAAVSLYTADLLEGWYQDWCLTERERLRHLYLIMLDKLMAYCEAHGEYESGITYGDRILGFDRAREYTHRGLMRLYALKGDRTEALRQFDRCARALREELDVRPAGATVRLYDELRTDRPGDPGGPPPPRTSATPADRALAGSLQELHAHLSDVQRRIERAMADVSARGERPSA